MAMALDGAGAASEERVRGPRSGGRRTGWDVVQVRCPSLFPLHPPRPRRPFSPGLARAGSPLLPLPPTWPSNPRSDVAGPHLPTQTLSRLGFCCRAQGSALGSEGH